MSDECSECNKLRTELLCDLLEEASDVLEAVDRGEQPKKGHIVGLCDMIRMVVTKAQEDVLGIAPPSAH